MASLSCCGFGPLSCGQGWEGSGSGDGFQDAESLSPLPTAHRTAVLNPLRTLCMRMLPTLSSLSELLRRKFFFKSRSVIFANNSAPNRDTLEFSFFAFSPPFCLQAAAVNEGLGQLPGRA